ncbi:cupin domain-containing protein [Naasia lichenicola]|uniref:Cupin domain-containing protein n=1 Tax=Naasia lichenicola TaxID=2565933 RepID=A0A4S4FQL6_9MICO|nr:cupin domain-containing protein [Naasia lichenicola]THG32860.1 cupin domain-containing protein [Naasia lichenicola]
MAAGAINFRVLATPSRGTSELSAWRAELSPGGSSGIHSLNHEQIVIVDEGEITLLVSGETDIGTHGDILVIPAGHLVELINMTDAVASATIVSPAGFLATVAGKSFAPPWSL